MMIMFLEFNLFGIVLVIVLIHIFIGALQEFEMSMYTMCYLLINNINAFSTIAVSFETP